MYDHDHEHHDYTSVCATGSIRADSYAIYDRGQRLVFQGKVHSRVNAH